MINKLKLHNIKDIICCGDIHGEFSIIINKINNLELKDTLLIILGDVGLGMIDEKIHLKVFDKLNPSLLENNNHLVMLHGNHDSPEIFNDPQTREPFNVHSNIHIVPDYTIIETYSMPFILNKIILCIGGATSIDRKYRIDQEKIYGQRKTYWENELPYYGEEMISEINEEYHNMINIICTHSTPSFCIPVDKNNLLVQSYMSLDPTLGATLDKERGIMDMIFWGLKDGEQNNITDWLYGHYHTHNVETHHDIKFTMCDCHEFNMVGYKPLSFD